MEAVFICLILEFNSPYLLLLVKEMDTMTAQPVSKKGKPENKVKDALIILLFLGLLLLRICTLSYLPLSIFKI
jgi:hypothetical protein